MLEFITKAEYWNLLDQDIERDLQPIVSPWHLRSIRDLVSYPRRAVHGFRKKAFPWHLKSIQDAVAYSHIKDCEGDSIAEVGGGDSRILKALSGKNSCTNIEKFEGRDGGPSSPIKFAQVANVYAFVGEFAPELKDASFDVLFSVSVVEHVTNPQLPDFIADSRRVLKPGGRMIHLVDMYLNDERREFNQERVRLYNSAFTDHKFQPLKTPQLLETSHLNFRESYCTNPDNVMYTWNSVAPNLRELRENSQSVTLIWAGTAID